MIATKAKLRCGGPLLGLNEQLLPSVRGRNDAATRRDDADTLAMKPRRLFNLHNLPHDERFHKCCLRCVEDQPGKQFVSAQVSAMYIRFLTASFDDQLYDEIPGEIQGLQPARYVSDAIQ